MIELLIILESIAAIAAVAAIAILVSAALALVTTAISRWML